MESTVVNIFVAVVAAVFLLAAWELVRLVLQRLGYVAAPAGWQRWAQRGALGLGALGLLCFAYGYFVEPYWPEVTRVRVESAKLPRGSRPVRFVHISDIHSDPRPRLEERLPGIIAAERPDFIVFTGDSINSRAGLPVLRALMTRLARVAPTYAVRGNWDSWYWTREDLFGGTGARELNGEAARVEVDGVTLWLAGVAVGDEGRIAPLLDSLPHDDLKIFLYHYPDEIYDIARRHDTDLYCAGHTHGGQVALPLYGALITFSKFGKRFESGLHKVEDTYLYVNRGVGMEGGRAPRVRFWARPEVTVIEIAPKS